MSSDLNKDKKEKTCQDKHADKDKDLLEFKKEERKPEKVREKTWYTIADIFTDESEDEDDSYNGGVAKFSDSLGLSDSHRKDSTPERDEIDNFQTDKHKKYSEGKTHSTEKQKTKNIKIRKKRRQHLMLEKREKPPWKNTKIKRTKIQLTQNSRIGRTDHLWIQIKTRKASRNYSTREMSVKKRAKVNTKTRPNT